MIEEDNSDGGIRLMCKGEYGQKQVQSMLENEKENEEHETKTRIDSKQPMF